MEFLLSSTNGTEGVPIIVDFRYRKDYFRITLGVLMNTYQHTKHDFAHLNPKDRNTSLSRCNNSTVGVGCTVT